MSNPLMLQHLTNHMPSQQSHQTFIRSNSNFPGFRNCLEAWRTIPAYQRPSTNPMEMYLCTGPDDKVKAGSSHQQRCYLSQLR